MNYFEFYDLPVSFNPDTRLVKQKFYALSKQYHPDFYINQSQEKQEEVLELSTINNNAYRVLSDPQLSLHYILELKGLLVEGENYSLPQDFLMEMMEVNEALMDLQFEPDAGKLGDIKKEVALIDLNMQQELDKLIDGFEGQHSAAQAVTLTGIKNLYYRKKYLSRINDSMFKLEAEL
jgi:molecular chaperone HscB